MDTLPFLIAIKYFVVADNIHILPTVGLLVENLHPIGNSSLQTFLSVILLAFIKDPTLPVGMNNYLLQPHITAVYSSLNVHVI